MSRFDVTKCAVNPRLCEVSRITGIHKDSIYNLVKRGWKHVKI